MCNKCPGDRLPGVQCQCYRCQTINGYVHGFMITTRKCNWKSGEIWKPKYMSWDATDIVMHKHWFTDSWLMAEGSCVVKYSFQNTIAQVLYVWFGCCRM